MDSSGSTALGMNHAAMYDTYMADSAQPNPLPPQAPDKTNNSPQAFPIVLSIGNEKSGFNFWQHAHLNHIQLLPNHSFHLRAQEHLLFRPVIIPT
jgi:hypothetical protein